MTSFKDKLNNPSTIKWNRIANESSNPKLKNPPQSYLLDLTFAPSATSNLILHKNSRSISSRTRVSSPSGVQLATKSFRRRRISISTRSSTSARKTTSAPSAREPTSPRVGFRLIRNKCTAPMIQAGAKNPVTHKECAIYYFLIFCCGIGDWHIFRWVKG